MMGMVFTELLEMVESKYSFDMVDAIIARAHARGSYTTVGYYDDDELRALVKALSEEAGVAIPELLHAYGVHIFARFLTLHPGFFERHADAPSFLKGLDTHVHTEVRKLYPAAHPPLFTWSDADGGGIVLEYQSHRGMWTFAHGLLEACIAHFGGKHRVSGIDDLSAGAGTRVRFHISAA